MDLEKIHVFQICFNPVTFDILTCAMQLIGIIYMS